MAEVRGRGGQERDGHGFPVAARTAVDQVTTGVGALRTEPPIPDSDLRIGWRLVPERIRPSA
jgi:hypothetical protein